MSPSTPTITETLSSFPESADKTISSPPPPSPPSSSTHSSSPPSSPTPTPPTPLTPLHHILGTLMNILILLLVVYTYSRFAIHLFLPFPLKRIPSSSSRSITSPGFSNYSACSPGGGDGLAGAGPGGESNGNKRMVLGMSHLMLTWLGAWVLTERWYGRVKWCEAF